MHSHQGRKTKNAGAANGGKLPPRCSFEPIEETRYLFVDEFQKVRIAGGEKPAERAVFRKQHGVAKGSLTVLSSCPAEFRVGLWAGGPYVCWMRWSSDAPPDVPDQKNNTLGFAIKLFGVSGATLAIDDPVANTADLIFQNSDIFFVDNVSDMCAISADFDTFIASHQRSKMILDEMAKEEGSLLAAHYHSTHPYAVGEQIVKYRLIPVDPPAARPGASPNCLAEDLADRLKRDKALFSLEAQRFVDDSVTPIDRATARWEEKISPFVPVATVEISAQDITVSGQPEYGESLAFSPWRTVHENRPVGSIADARRAAYPSSAAVRRSLNGQSMTEPKQPR